MDDSELDSKFNLACQLYAPGARYQLRDDGKGITILNWDHESKSKPTREVLKALDVKTLDKELRKKTNKSRTKAWQTPTMLESEIKELVAEGEWSESDEARIIFNTSQSQVELLFWDPLLPGMTRKTLQFAP